MPRITTPTNTMPPIGAFVVLYEQGPAEGRCRERDGTYAYWLDKSEAYRVRDRLAADNFDASFDVAEVTAENEYTYCERN